MSNRLLKQFEITLEELMDRVIICPSGCWLWTGADSGTGRGGYYGKISKRIKGKLRNVYIHRVVYVMFKGPIPRKHQVDHVCRHWGWLPIAHRRCCNPDHLEAVPGKVNQQRKYLHGLDRG